MSATKSKAESEVSLRAKELIIAATNAAFDCGEWDRDSDDREYEEVSAICDGRREAIYAYVGRLEAALHRIADDGNQPAAKIALTALNPE